MNDLFNFEEDKSQITNQNNGASIIGKTSFKAKVKTETRNAAFEEIINSAGGMPKEGEIISLKSNGLSDTGSIFLHISKNADIEEMYLATWVISRKNIEMLISAIDTGKIKKLYFVVSMRLKELKKKEYAFLIEEFLKRPTNIFFKVCNSHAKTFSVKDINGNFYTVTGSGNWTENPRIENYLILNNESIFNHNKEWITSITK